MTAFLTPALLYFIITIAGLLAVGGVLVLIGKAAQACPQTAAAARLGTLVVTTAFLAIGTGVITLIGAALPVLSAGAATGLYIAIGLAFVALGLGFQYAAVTLRDILNASRAQDPAPSPAPSPTLSPAAA
ncbi:MAG: hypothetical protein AAFY66_18775 [Pseudomonadota bacterium]